MIGFLELYYIFGVMTRMGILWFFRSFSQNCEKRVEQCWDCTLAS